MKEKELILKFLSQLKEMKEILRIARQHSQTNENFRSKVQRLIEQIGFIGEFVKILREKSEKKCVIFIKSELEALTQLNAHSKKLTKVTSNCEIASNLIVSLTLS